MKKSLIGMLSLLATFSSAHASFEIENAFFKIKTYQALCVDCSTITVEDEDGFNPNGDLDYQNRYLYTGSVEINEIDPTTFDMRKTVIPNVTMRMTATGVIADFTAGGNTRMRISGLSGKKIGDIFDSKYVGGKFRLNALANLSGMYTRNSHGVKLVDTERLIAPGVAIDAFMVQASLSLNPSTTTVVSTITQKKTGQVVQEDESVSTIFDRTIE